MHFKLLFLCILVLLVDNFRAYKIRFGRERSRILKLKKRKGALVNRLNLLTRTRGIGIFPILAKPDDSVLSDGSEEELEQEEEQQKEELQEFNTFVESDNYTLEKKKRGPKNPVIEPDLERFDELFRKIPELRTPKRIVTIDSRPGGIDPNTYAQNFAEVDHWDIHPSKIRVRGKYFSKLYQYELREPLKRHQNDTGSPEVVIASLTAKIDYLSLHVNNNRKDTQARRQIIKLAYQRRRLLKYLYRTKRDKFDMLTKTFNLKFEDSPFSYEKILPKYTHLLHRNTKRYRNAKEAKEARLR